MKLVIVSPVRLLGDCVSICLQQRDASSRIVCISEIALLYDVLKEDVVTTALIDVTQGFDLDAVRQIAMAHPNLILVALGLSELRQAVIRCGQAGFAGFVPREASVEELCLVLSEVQAGRLSCSPEVSGELLRALFRNTGPVQDVPAPRESLTAREEEILRLIGRGLANKEIARELNLSLATVKHHVHHVLQKLNVGSRTQAMNRARSMGTGGVSQGYGRRWGD
jgi:DNA-binding NarL/FixJ family response regulator